MEIAPPVSVVVVNYNGLDHLGDCFASLRAADYPAGRLELLMVDNGSRDRSVAYVNRSYPEVRVVQSGSNIGFSAANNLGAREATGELVVFLNNDMRVSPGFIRQLSLAIGSGPKVSCAGAKILNWDGSRLDFAGSAAHFAGYAYQVGYGEPAGDPQFGDIRPILFACGGAMIVRRNLFLEVGGFDEQYFMFYEDLDLGWRLWLLGHEVVFAPDAVVYHRHHGSVGKVPDFRRQVLYKRNAFYTLFKNYDDANLARVLPAALLGTVDGVVESMTRGGRLRLSEFDVSRGRRASRPRIRLNRSETSALVALHDVTDALPHLIQKRQFVQKRRTQPDDVIARLMRRPFRHWPGVPSEVQYRLVEAFGLHALFEGLPRRVLVISSDILPYPGLPTVGSGLRAWGLGQALASQGHEVIFSMPKAALDGRVASVPDEVQALAWENWSLEDVVRKADPDVLVVCNWPVLALLRTEWLGIPVILDQHGPHLLEREYQGAGDRAENIAHKLSALRKADFFTCAGHKQWAYFQSWLEKAGWSPEERDERSAVVPVSLSPELPDRRPAERLTFVYGGVFLPWQNPTVGLTELVNTLDRTARGRLLFFGGPHPFYRVDTGIFAELLETLGKSAHVSAPGMVSHDELIDHYVQAHVAIDVMERNPERELAFTTRTVEYLWCGLPVIYHDYGELSDHIREYDAGWTVAPDDREGIARILTEIFDHPECLASKSRNAQRLVRERLTWERTGACLDRFVRSPTMRVHDRSNLPFSARTLPRLVRRALSAYRREGTRATWRKTAAYLRRYAAR